MHRRDLKYHWLVDSMEYIDFGWDVLTQEIILIGYGTKGAVTYSDLTGMSFPQYERVMKETMALLSEIKRVQTGGAQVSEGI